MHHLLIKKADFGTGIKKETSTAFMRASIHYCSRYFASWDRYITGILYQSTV